jgi:transcriptional regulator with GAF, ATPase, and Fis domain
MFHKDKYRLIAIVSFIVSVLLLVLLFIVLWNNLSVNPEVNTSNSIYLILFLIFIAVGALFVVHLLQVNLLHADHKIEIPDKDADQPESDKESTVVTKESPVLTYDIDIDQLAEFIVPKQNPQEDMETYAEKILTNIAKQFEVVLGIIYLKKDDKPEFWPVSTYAWASDKAPAPFITGEGLNGQAAKNKSVMKVTDIPENYIKITSSLGKGSPGNLILVPLLLNKESIGMLELAFFKEIDNETEWTFKNLAKIISNSLVTKLKAIKDKE